MNDHVIIGGLSGPEVLEVIGPLSAVLIDCIDGGASVSFMAPLPRERAEAFWRDVAVGVAAGERLLLVARERATGDIVGTVQVVLGQPENQPHRADVAKMLVHRRFRNRGVGATLMRAAEDAARSAGKTLLVLDTADDVAMRLYRRLGWQEAGTIPGYALWPEGGFCDTTFFYKRISGA